MENYAKKPFETVAGNLMQYNGQDFEILRELTEDEADVDEVGRMFKIKFQDGFITDAFEDEVLWSPWDN